MDAIIAMEKRRVIRIRDKGAGGGVRGWFGNYYFLADLLLERKKE